jgi:hypothetical protein
MTDITCTSTAVAVDRLEVPRAMISAMEPYRVANQLLSTYGDGSSLFTYGEFAEILLNEEDGFLRVNDQKQLLCLQNVATTMTNNQAWRLNFRAKDDLRDLPALPDVQAALRAIRLDLDTEPPLESRVELIGGLLDVQGISPDLKYIQVLAWKLGDCPPRKTETNERNKPYFSIATIARTIDEVWTTLRPEYGRPVPIADVLDIAGRNASEMIGLRNSTTRLNNTVVRLQRIVQATRNAKPPEPSDTDDEDLIPF